jgi:hypothetical protein
MRHTGILHGRILQQQPTMRSLLLFTPYLHHLLLLRQTPQVIGYFLLYLIHPLLHGSVA